MSIYFNYISTNKLMQFRKVEKSFEKSKKVVDIIILWVYTYIKIKQVTGLNEWAQAIAYDEIVEKHIKKAEKEIKKNRIKELIAEGIDPEVAKVMAKVGL